MDTRWEPLVSGDLELFRREVPGGWLYTERSWQENPELGYVLVGNSLCFVPEPKETE